MCAKAGAYEGLPREQQWCAATVLGMQGFFWDYMGKAKRRRALYPGGAGTSRIPLLPDSTSLEEIAKAAGRAAAAEIAAGTPAPPEPGDEAGSDPPTSSSSSSTSSSGSPMAVNDQGHSAVQQEQSQQNRQQEPREHPQPHPPGSVPSAVQQEQSQQNRPQEPREHPHPHPPGQSPMAGVVEQGGPDSSQQGGVSKRPRLLLDRPRGTDQGGALSPSTSSSLYPPGFAGVRCVHGDVPAQEHVGYDGWTDELLEAMAEESQEANDWEPQWDADGEQAPDLPPDELAIVDQRADYDELARLLEMGVARRPREGEDISGYGRLTTKVVRDWRKRPTWVRRSRLVAREFKAMSDWSAELFAPASTLAAVHSFIAVALARGLQIAVLDVKDAYLNVEQPHPVVIEVERAILGETGPGVIELVLDRLLPGQRIGASAWFGFAKNLLTEAGMENYENGGLWGKRQRGCSEKKALAKAIKEMGTSGVNVARIKSMMPLLILMTQAVNVQGLSLAAPFVMLGNEDDIASWVATAAVGFLLWVVVAWLPSLFYKCLKWFLGRLFQRGATAEVAVGPDLPDLPDKVMRHTAATQANIPWRYEARKEDRLFAEEYVRRCTHLEQVHSEKCREVEACEEALREVRGENRALRATIETLRRRRDPEEIVVATSRGQRFHLPTCGHVRDSIVKRYTPCRDCIGPTG